MLKRLLVLVSIVLLFSSRLFATPISADEAKAVAQAWADENKAVFGVLGVATEVVGEYDEEKKLLCWVVSFSNGDSIIASADSALDPIISVLPKSRGSLAMNHPIKSLLYRDMKMRKKALANREDNKKEFAKAERQWSRLSRVAKKVVATSVATNPEVLTNSEVRIMSRSTKTRAKAPIDPEGFSMIIDGFEDDGKYSFWNQAECYFRPLGIYYDGGIDNYGYETGSNQYVFNKYTPNHYVSGCVATTGGTLLQFFNSTHAPKGIEDICYVFEPSYVEPYYNSYPVRLTTKGIDYDWSILPRSMGGEAEDIAHRLTADQIDLLARVSYDIGICTLMDYGFDSSGTFEEFLATALRRDFGFADARFIGNFRVTGGDESDILNYGAISPAAYEKLIYSQIRSGAPVALGVLNEAEGIAHSLLAVGYGESRDGETKFTRLAFGWSGYCNAWYALPTIELTDGDRFDVIQSIITMIGTTRETMALYGSAKTSTGEAIANATITIPNASKTLTTDSHGYWATRVDPDLFTNRENQIICTLPNGFATNQTFFVGDEAANRDSNLTVTYSSGSDDGFTAQLYVSPQYTLVDSLPDEITFAIDPAIATGSYLAIENGEIVVDNVPFSWTENFPTFTDLFGSNFESALAMNAANSRYTVKQCYIAGLDPTDSSAEFKAFIAMDSNNKPTITWSPDLNENDTKHLRDYIVEGKENFSDEWSVANRDIHHFFKVRVELPSR